MEITRKAGPADRTAEVNIWHCRGCGVVHLAVGEKVVNFTHSDFAEFAEAVVDINYSGWESGPAISAGERLLSLITGDSETVH